MKKRAPKICQTFSISPSTLRLINILAELRGWSRSAIAEEILFTVGRQRLATYRRERREEEAAKKPSRKG